MRKKHLWTRRLTVSPRLQYRDKRPKRNLIDSYTVTQQIQRSAQRPNHSNLFLLALSFNRGDRIILPDDLPKIA